MKRTTARLLAAILLLPMLSGCLFTSCSQGDTAGDAITTSKEQAMNTNSPTAGESTQPNAPTEEVTNPPATNEATTGTPTTNEPTTDEPVDPPAPESTTYRYVVVIGVDGAGAFFKNANTPNLDRIFADGALTYRCLTANPSISAQCWGSLLHGVVPTVHKLTNAIVAATPYPTDSAFPSFFRVIRENDANATLASFSHWNPINVGIVEDGIGVHKVGNMGDAALTHEICTYLASNNPTAMFVQFDEADAAGHSYGYGTADQLQKISELDGYIGQIYDAYAQKGILDETLFIVTADHGGSNKSHGGLTDEEMYVMFAATGKTVEKGEIRDIEIRDTAAIVLHALGYEAPEGWTARVPSGLFKGVTAGERPVYVDKNADRYHETQPTPEVGSEGYITNFIKDHELKYYLPFDGDVNDVCGATVTTDGKLYFVEGYFGQGISLDDGYVSISNYAPAKSSFSIAFWLKTEGMNSDPCILSNKNWASGKNIGWALCFNKNKAIRFNAGDGAGNRVDADATLPANFRAGWMHVIVTVDRENGKITLCYDFGATTDTAITAKLLNTTFTAMSSLNIGQDGTGAYSASLAATMDELMIFDGVLDRADFNALAQYYGVDLETPAFRYQESTDTPAKDSNSYITNYVDKELIAYLPFDGNVTDSTGKSTTTAKGSVSYQDGFYGQGVKLGSGYVSIADFAPGMSSFSVGFWININSIEANNTKYDPPILSNKNWQTGKNTGFMLSLSNAHSMKVNLGDGSNRTDGEHLLPGDYQNGWVYVVMVMDREKGEMRLSYDFGEFFTVSLTDEVKNDSANSSYNVLNVGQDATGSYTYSPDAVIDELMVFDGALTQADVAALANYFGVGQE